MTINPNKIAGYVILTVAWIYALFLVYLLSKAGHMGIEFWVSFLMVSVVGCPLAWFLIKRYTNKLPT